MTCHCGGIGVGLGKPPSISDQTEGDLGPWWSGAGGMVTLPFLRRQERAPVNLKWAGLAGNTREASKSGLKRRGR